MLRRLCEMQEQVSVVRIECVKQLFLLTAPLFCFIYRFIDLLYHLSACPRKYDEILAFRGLENKFSDNLLMVEPFGAVSQIIF